VKCILWSLTCGSCYVRRERSGRPNSWHCEAAPLESIFQPVRLTLLVKCSSCLHHSKAHRRRSNVFNHLSMAYYLLVPNFPDYDLWVMGPPLPSLQANPLRQDITPTHNLTSLNPAVKAPTSPPTPSHTKRSPPHNPRPSLHKPASNSPTNNEFQAI
jgi:hypothetical protein